MTEESQLHLGSMYQDKNPYFLSEITVLIYSLFSTTTNQSFLKSKILWSSIQNKVGKPGVGWGGVGGDPEAKKKGF